MKAYIPNSDSVGNLVSLGQGDLATLHSGLVVGFGPTQANSAENSYPKTKAKPRTNQELGDDGHGKHPW